MYSNLYAYTHHCLHLLETSTVLSFNISNSCEEPKVFTTQRRFLFLCFENSPPLWPPPWSYTSSILYHYLWEGLKQCVGEFRFLSKVTKARVYLKRLWNLKKLKARVLLNVWACNGWYKIEQIKQKIVIGDSNNTSETFENVFALYSRMFMKRIHNTNTFSHYILLIFYCLKKMWSI